jgi:type VI secretion system protein ImpF
MSAQYDNQALLPSLLDRLLDPDSLGSAEQPGYGMTQILAMVRQDVEDLLNTRKNHHHIDPLLEEVQNSIATYGLPDLTQMEASTSQARELIGKTIKGVIERFEPRLKEVHVELYQPGDQSSSRGFLSTRDFGFHISAKLNVDPAPELEFDTVTVLDARNGEFLDKGEKEKRDKERTPAAPLGRKPAG